ncbi:MAG: PQQ-dependent sugar dehydrogenase [Bacteroidota bacterium]
MVKKRILIVSSCALIYFNACNFNKSVDTSTIATDSLSISQGKTLFLQNCSSCHTFRQDAIGPQLGGVTSAVSADWIKNYIKDPKSIIESGDDRAGKLHEKYKTLMPSFSHYSDDEINSIIAFLNTQKAPDRLEALEDIEIKNPIPQPIPLSDLIIDLELVTQIPPSGEAPLLTRIAKLDIQPNTEKLFILDLRGKLYSLTKKSPGIYLDMAKERPDFINEPGLGTGFGSFAFHPEFADNGLLYTTHTESRTSKKADFNYDDSIQVTLQWVLSEWKSNKPLSPAFSGVKRELLRIDMVTGIHGVQEITFNPLSKPADDDYGLLYIGVGDGGSVENNYSFLAHSTEKIWGTILRIDPSGRNSSNGQYGIPQNNPFAKSDNAKELKEIYAYGFRNPHRITWSKSGQMLACNIGHGNLESINLVLPGHDYGWPIREGTFLVNPFGDLNKLYSLPANDSIFNVTYPVAQYDHDDGKAINGGVEYWGTTISSLMGKFLFGDIANGRLFYIEMSDIKLGSQAPIKEWQVSVNGVPKTILELCGTNRADLRFGRCHNGEVYLFTKPDGKVYRLMRPSVMKK